MLRTDVTANSPSTGAVIEFNQFAATSSPPPVAGVFDLWLNTQLTDAGGVVLIATNTAEYANNNQSDSFYLTSGGTVVASGSAPEPATAGLLLVGIGLVALGRKRA